MEARVSLGSVLVLELGHQCLGRDPDRIALGGCHDLGFQTAHVGVEAGGRQFFFVFLVVGTRIVIVIVVVTVVVVVVLALDVKGIVSGDQARQEPASDVLGYQPGVGQYLRPEGRVLQHELVVVHDPAVPVGDGVQVHPEQGRAIHGPADFGVLPPGRHVPSVDVDLSGLGWVEEQPVPRGQPGDDARWFERQIGARSLLLGVGRRRRLGRSHAQKGLLDLVGIVVGGWQVGRVQQVGNPQVALQGQAHLGERKGRVLVCCSTVAGVARVFLFLPAAHGNVSVGFGAAAGQGRRLVVGDRHAQGLEEGIVGDHQSSAANVVAAPPPAARGTGRPGGTASTATDRCAEGGKVRDGPVRQGRVHQVEAVFLAPDAKDL
mmetsp:Transcript_2400/g.5739  ORF Transcript_2400/g.5739 Transcript_2400/m.5739 type:complete len:376 (+) Transcript_2400:1004-2131(+)